MQEICTKERGAKVIMGYMNFRTVRELIEFRAGAPLELEDFAYKIKEYGRNLQRAETSLRTFRFSQIQVNNLSDRILGLMSSLEALTWELVAVVRKATDELQEEKRHGFGFEDDLTNVMAHLRNEINMVFSAPEEHQNYQRFALLVQNLHESFNSLIAPSILEAWRNTKKPKISKKAWTHKEEFYCEYNQFSKALINSLKRRSGVFKKQLFVMSKGKIQQAFIPQPPTPSDKPVGPMEKVEEYFKDLGGET